MAQLAADSSRRVTRLTVLSALSTTPPQPTSDASQGLDRVTRQQTVVPVPVQQRITASDDVAAVTAVNWDRCRVLYGNRLSFNVYNPRTGVATEPKL